MWVGTAVAVVGEAWRQRVTELDRARLLVHPHARDMQAVHHHDGGCSVGVDLVADVAHRLGGAGEYLPAR